MAAHQQLKETIEKMVFNNNNEDNNNQETNVFTNEKLEELMNSNYERDNEEMMKLDEWEDLDKVQRKLKSELLEMDKEMLLKDKAAKEIFSKVHLLTAKINEREGIKEKIEEATLKVISICFNLN